MAEFKTDENAFNEIVKRTAQQQTSQEAQLRQRMQDSSQPLTLQTQQEQAGRANIGDIQRQQQGQTEFNQALQRQSDLTLGAQQQTIGGQQEFATSQLEQNVQNRNTDIYYRLFQNRKLTARQFEKLTGITVQQEASRRKVQESNDPGTEFFGGNFARPDELAAITTLRGFENQQQKPSPSEQSAISLINAFDRE
jgi:hypothetical protein